MTLLAALREAVEGWRQIILGLPNWGDHFTLSRQGLLHAFGVYFGLVVIVLAIQSGLWSVADPLVLLIGLLFFSLPVVGFGLSVLLTASVLRWQVPMVAALVPGVYALGLLLISQVLLSLISPSLVILAYIALAFLMFRAGRVVAQMGVASSIAFAVLTIALLVLPAQTLYMLAVAQSGPIGPSS
jgi:hypothetical protein